MDRLTEDDASVADSVDSLRELMTLDELTNRIGVSVRNVRFYTAKGLVPPPIRRGRSGYYTPEHLARLELIIELQEHGFTLSAIERYLAQIPPSATPEDIAVHRATLAPWMSVPAVPMTKPDLERRMARKLSDDDLDTLAALGIVHPPRKGRTMRVSTTYIALGGTLLDQGFPAAAARGAADIYARHGKQIADELQELFRERVWPAYLEAGGTTEGMIEIVERLKPLSIASLVSAYEKNVATEELSPDR